VCEELVSIKAEMARICGSFRMPKGQYDDVIKYAFDKQLAYLTGVERIVNQNISATAYIQSFNLSPVKKEPFKTLRVSQISG
jgi:hypothetical protein